MKQVEILE